MEENQNIKKYSEEYEKKVDFEGEGIELPEAIDKEIIIYDFAKRKGKYGDFAIIDASIEEKRVQFLLGSKIVMEQLDKIKEDKNFPMQAKITKGHSDTSDQDYYTLS